MEIEIDQNLNKETKIDQISTMVSGRRGARRGVLETISDPKLRRATFLKRKKNQKKKLHELTTLCDVEAFMICYGPSGEIDTWPEGPRELQRVVDRYMKIERSEREKRVMGVSDFIDAQKKKLEGELNRVKRENEERNSGVFCWDSRIDELGEESLKELLGSIDNKLKILKEKIESMKNQNNHMGAEIIEMAWVDHQTPNYMFDDPQFFDQTDDQLPILEEPPIYSLEYNTQFANNSQFFFNSSHIAEAVAVECGYEIWDPSMGSSLINPFIGSAYQAQPIQAIMPPPGPPLTNPTTNYSFQNFDFSPYGSWL